MENTMPFTDGKNGVNKCISPFPDLTLLAQHAKQRAQQAGTEYRQCQQDCNVDYTTDHLEVQWWHNVTLQIEWLAWLLLDKAEQGHCHKHVKPCEHTGPLHLQMVRDFMATLQQLLNNMDHEIKRVEQIVQARSTKKGS
jgi:hypothetical protein